MMAHIADLNSQLSELRGRIKWVEYNLMKYKFAASHGAELKSIIDRVLRGTKKHSKWQMFSRSSCQNRKLDEEVEWYRKKLKFFREDVERMKLLQQDILNKYMTREEQKSFASRTCTLENALKGNPTNYPGSWLETSRHSGMTLNISTHFSSHGNVVVPLTISTTMPSRLETNSTNVSTHSSSQSAHSENSPIQIESNDTLKENLNKLETETIECNPRSISCAKSCMGNQTTCQLNPEKLLKDCSAVQRKETPESSTHDFQCRNVLPSEQCQGDKVSISNASEIISESNVYVNESIVLSVDSSKTGEEGASVNEDFDRRNPFSRGQAVHSTTRNPFDEEEESHENCMKMNEHVTKMRGVNCNFINPTVNSVVASVNPNQNSSNESSSYESVGEVLSVIETASSSRLKSQHTPPPQEIRDGTGLTPLTRNTPSQFTSTVSIPPHLSHRYDSSFNSYREISGSFPPVRYPVRLLPHLTGYMYPETKPYRNVLKKFSTFIQGKKK